MVGQFIGSGLASDLNFLGATLFMLAAWMAGVSLAFGVSWLTIVDRIGAGIWSGVGWMRARRSVARDVAVGVEAKKARVEAAKVEVKKRGHAREAAHRSAGARRWRRASASRKSGRCRCSTPPKSGELPPLKLLDDPPAREAGYSSEALEAMSRLVELKLKDFGVEVEVVAVQPGPVVTRFEMRPAPGVKVSQITGLAKDLARSLSAISVRVVEVIPGKSVMGLEIPNEKREIVTLGEIIKSKAYDDVASPLALALGKDIGGAPVVRGSREDAAPAGRRHHRLRQVRRHQRHDPVAALQEHGRTRAADHDRSRRCWSCRCTRAFRICSRPWSPT